MAENKKNLVIRVDEDFHQNLKLYVTLKKTTLQDYIVNLITKDMEENENKENN